MKKIKLIYILGTSFSGSTLLSLVLGAQKNILNLGEVWALESDYRVNRKCSCGEDVKKCDYWQKIISSYKSYVEDNNEEHAFDFIHPSLNSDLLFQPLTMPQRVLHHITSNPRWLFDGKEISQYVCKNYILFNFILSLFKRECDYIIDSSKSLERLMILDSSDLFDIHVIFLVRNGMSIVGKKLYNSSGDQQRTPGIKTAEKTIRWILETRRYLQYLKKRSAKKQYRTTYKEFSTKPEHVVSEICSFLDIDYNPNLLIKNSREYFTKSDQHIFTGNKLIENFHNISEIKYVDKWERKLTSMDKKIFQLCAGDKYNKKIFNRR